LLYGLVRQLRPDTIVEIGAWQGHSTLWMAQACRDNKVGHVYAIDNWTLAGASRQALDENLLAAALDNYATLVEGDSLQVPWPPSVDFAFIDGCHDYAHPQGEFEKAVQLGARTVVVHDTATWWGPRRWLETWRMLQAPSSKLASWELLELPARGDEDGLAIWQRKEDSGVVRFTEDAYPGGHI
jgi:predicted O-methyltransferase YrrM